VIGVLWENFISGSVEASSLQYHSDRSTCPNCHPGVLLVRGSFLFGMRETVFEVGDALVDDFEVGGRA
jgi:hypothetical protein